MAQPEVQCSSRGCRKPATAALAWNNPKLHPPKRIKIWLACAEHRDTLAEFLRERGFLRGIGPYPPEESD